MNAHFEKFTACLWEGLIHEWKQALLAPHLPPVESLPKGPAEPLVWRAAVRTLAPSRQSKTTGSITGLGAVEEIRASGCVGCLGGCLFSNLSRTLMIS